MEDENLTDQSTPTPEIPDSEQIQGSTKSGNFFQRKVDSMKSRVNSEMNLRKTQLNNSIPGSLVRGIKDARGRKGFRGKMNAMGNALGKTNAGKSLANKAAAIKKKLKKAFETIKRLKKPIIIGSIIISVLFFFINIAYFFIGVSQTIGASPHYYCLIDAPKEVKKSALYKQYCVTTTRDVDENGIPIVPFMNQGIGVLNWDTGQFENDYSDVPWPNGLGTMGPNSCGPSAAAMIISYYIGEVVTPADPRFASVICTDGPYRTKDGISGTGWNTQVAMAEVCGLEADIRYDLSIENIDQVLADGDMCILLMDSTKDPSIVYDDCQWTTGGHYIAVIGKMADGTYAVNESGGSGFRSYWGLGYTTSGQKHTVEASALMNPTGGKGSTWVVIHAPDD